MLWQFLRMRQACNHPLLVKGATHGHELAAAEVRDVQACVAALCRTKPCAECGQGGGMLVAKHELT